MSERFPGHERLSLTSMARDITLHAGQRINDDDSRIESKWDHRDEAGDRWFMILATNGIYGGDLYTLRQRHAESSEHRIYRYSFVNNSFTHENPPGKVIDQDEMTTATAMRELLASGPLVDNVVYDIEGAELQTQDTFMDIGAQLAVNAVLDTNEGTKLFGQLLKTHDIGVRTALHEAFYQQTRRKTDSFSVGRLAMHQALQPLIAAARPKQFLPGPSELSEI